MTDTNPARVDAIVASLRRNAATGPVAARSRGILAGMRVRKKLIFLHTVFSLSLAMILIVGIREKVRGIVRLAEFDLALRTLEREVSLNEIARPDSPLAAENPGTRPGPTSVRVGDAASLSLSEHQALALRKAAENAQSLEARAIEVGHSALGTTAAIWLDDERGFALATARSDAARSGVNRLYVALVVALLAVYGLVALALEVLVLPTHVYAPIRRILRADRAVQAGEEGEIIPDRDIPADELGEIMRSRNESIRTLRAHERDLAHALEQLEVVASDLTRKNHLLERARENLADADRLRSLAIMSAGLAHEMNTPLTVLKGLGQRLASEPAKGLDPDKAALLLRVVERLEGLSESLLDFARVRPPQYAPINLSNLVAEAVTLVRLDRGAAAMQILPRIPPDLIVECDHDRILQVLVNLVRNAVDALADSSDAPLIEIDAQNLERHGDHWVSITIADNGPGIHPSVLPRLFDPFVSTRLDARGTGLGLAVAEGIVKEHDGVMLARNHPSRRGAVFEVLLPARAQGGKHPMESPLGDNRERS